MSKIKITIEQKRVNRRWNENIREYTWQIYPIRYVYEILLKNSILIQKCKQDTWDDEIYTLTLKSDCDKLELKSKVIVLISNLCDGAYEIKEIK